MLPTRLLPLACPQRNATCVGIAPQRAVVPARRVVASFREATRTEGAFSKESKAKIEVLLKRFGKADTDGNGHIDREELRSLLESTESGESYLLTQHWLPDEELDVIMRHYDKNRDGVISFDEFKSIVYDGILLEGKLQDYQAAFNAVDKSGNGTIGPQEMSQLFSALGNPISMEKVIDIFQKYDRQEKGQIDFKGFMRMCRNQLLDLKAMRDYMAMDDKSPPSGAVVDTIAGEMTLIASEAELEEIIAANPGKLVVVFASTSWCQASKKIQRSIQRLAENYKDTMVFVKLFGNANRDTKELFKDRLKVRDTPAFIALRDGTSVYTLPGATRENLEAGLRSLVQADDLPGSLYA